VSLLSTARLSQPAASSTLSSTFGRNAALDASCSVTQPWINLAVMACPHPRGPAPLIQPHPLGTACSGPAVHGPRQLYTCPARLVAIQKMRLPCFTGLRPAARKITLQQSQLCMRPSPKGHMQLHAPMRRDAGYRLQHSKGNGGERMQLRMSFGGRPHAELVVLQGNLAGCEPEASEARRPHFLHGDDPCGTSVQLPGDVPAGPEQALASGRGWMRASRPENDRDPQGGQQAHKRS
jgi:hypothetical protein